MTYQDFLSQVIESGIKAARSDYKPGSDKLRGAVDGFDLCRGKDPVALALTLKTVGEDVRKAYREQADDYWYWRCREAESSLWEPSSSAFCKSFLK